VTRAKRPAAVTRGPDLRASQTKIRPDGEGRCRNLAAATANIGHDKALLFPRCNGPSASTSTEFDNVVDGRARLRHSSAELSCSRFNAGKVNQELVASRSRRRRTAPGPLRIRRARSQACSRGRRTLSSAYQKKGGSARQRPPRETDERKGELMEAGRPELALPGRRAPTSSARRARSAVRSRDSTRTTGDHGQTRLRFVQLLQGRGAGAWPAAAGHARP